MTFDSDQFDFFVSYARKDNANGWIADFLAELKAEHATFAPDRPLRPFFDQHEIDSLDDWRHRVFVEGLAKSRLFVAFISPNYFASEWCRREWKAWIDTEIAKHILSAGAAPIYLVEVPGFVGQVSGLSEQATLDEQEVSRKIAELCGLPQPHDGFVQAASPIVRQMRDRRQVTSAFVKPFMDDGIAALRRADVRRVLTLLAHDLDERADQVRAAAKSATTVPPYNKKFSGRLDELLLLRERLKDDRSGVITGIHGLGGIGKTELAFTYAHAFASAYPGGRFIVPCDGRATVAEAALALGDLFRDRISDDERKTAESYFAAIVRCLGERLARLGHILLLLDNVSDRALLHPEQIDSLCVLGPRLHLLATTRLPPPPGARGNWLTLGELPEADALDLLEKHRPFVSDAERAAARMIVQRLGGFTLAVELVAAWLAAHVHSSSYAQLAEGLGLDDMVGMAEEGDVQLRRHNHERRLTAVLGPVLESLSAAERRALEFAALLPPDCVPLPWLKELVVPAFPELAKSGGPRDPWMALGERLLNLAIFNPAEGEDHQPRVLRIHRLLQEVILTGAAARVPGLMDELVACMTRRIADMGYFWHEEGRRWEIVALVETMAALLERGDVRGAHLAEALGFPLARLTLALDSVALLESAISLLRRQAPEEKATLYKLEHFLGEVYGRRGDYEKADALIRGAAHGQTALLGPRHVDTLLTMNNIGWVLSLQGRNETAEPYFVEAMKGLEEVLGPTHHHTLASVNNVAGVESERGNLVRSTELYQRVYVGMSANLGIKHPDTQIAACNLASNLQQMGRIEEAEALFNDALDAREEVLGEKHPETLESVSFLFNFYFATHDFANAEIFARRAYEGRLEVLGVAHPDTRATVRNLIFMLAGTQQLDASAAVARGYAEALAAKCRDEARLVETLEAALQSYAVVLIRLARTKEQILAELRLVAQHADVEGDGTAMALRVWTSLADSDMSGLPSAMTPREPEVDDHAVRPEISPLQARQMALDFFARGEYAFAKDILEVLLLARFEVVSTHLHLAHIGLITDDLGLAHEHVAGAWAERGAAEPYLAGRLHWFRIALDLLEDGDGAFAQPRLREEIESLRAGFADPRIHADWIMQPVLDHLAPQLSPRGRALLTALAAALSSADALPQLETCPDWKRT